MCERITYLTLFVFSLCLVPAGPLGAAEADLELWLEFEDNANDSSDYARPTSQEDAPVYIDGVVGRATDLRGDDYVGVTGWKGITGTSAFTIATWINSGDAAGLIVGWGTGRGVDGEDIQFRTANTGTLRIDNGSGNIRMTTKVHDNEWHHIAVTVAENGTMSLDDVALYLDGFDDTNPGAGTIDDSPFNVPATGYDVRIGREYDDPAGTSERRWNGDLDDLRIYSRELSATEIRVLALEAGPILTVPEDDTELSDTSVTLEWLPGVYAADTDGHEVFLSTLLGDVSDGTASASQGLTSNNWYLALGLAEGETYYWKVDAVNVVPSPGRWSSEIRSFFVPPARAYNPSPTDAAVFVDTSATLSWSSGRDAVSQQVFFGESFADVSAGDPGTDKGQQSETTYTPTLAPSTTYYWRIDSITGSGPVPGDVWSFTTEPDMPIDDPNLVGYWKLNLDEPSGTVAVDYSGYDNHGSLRGDAQFVEGHIDEAVLLDGNGDYVNIDGYKGVLGTSSFSVLAWIRTSSTITQNSIIGWGTGAGARFNFRMDTANDTDYSVRYSNGNGNVQGNTALNDDEWRHIGITVVGGYNADSQYVRIYTDGLDDTRESSDATSDLDIVAGEDLGIGSRPDSTDSFDGLIDDVRLYDRVLSASEIEAIGFDQPSASQPYPSDGAVHPDTTVTLAWRTGVDAEFHNVYFGTDSTSVPLVSENQPVDSNSYGPVAVELGKTYYWYVDEVNDPCVWAGELWSFSVVDHLVVDDFDSYVSLAGPNEPSLLSTWRDGTANGTGSTISLEDEFVGKSMALAYDNGGATDYSEAELIFASGEDWATGGVKAIALEFRGDVNNTGQWLYAAVEDTDGNSATVTYDAPEGLVDDNWQVWNIALQDFSDEGVDLTRVKKLVVGVSGSGGSGVLYVDNIRLYPPRCLPEYAVASFDGDCTTGFEELDILLAYWLAADYDVTAAEPDSAGLRVHYNFDETFGTTANDSSAGGHHGTVDPNGADAWDSDGYDGYCLAFDGNFAVTVPEEVFDGISDEVTISVWVHVDANVNPNSVGRAEFSAGPDDVNEPWDRVAWIQDNPEDYVGQWGHYAFVKAAGESIMRIYHNGILVAQNTESLQPMDGAGESKIGSKADGSGGYQGKLDEFRVYDYALSHAEVLYLALGGIAQLHQPLRPVLSPVDPYEDGTVTFLDFAVLGEWWLRESLWP